MNLGHRSREIEDMLTEEEIARGQRLVRTDAYQMSWAKRRNLIAHGEDTFITIDDLDELTNETITLMRTFGDALENHVYVREYRAA
jgi:hypothetical protein